FYLIQRCLLDRPLSRAMTSRTSLFDAVSYDRPYTGTMPPRVTLFSGEARNAIVAATSSTFGQAAKSALGMAAPLPAGSTIEGATALRRLRSFATSSASTTVSAATAALLAV